MIWKILTFITNAPAYQCKIEIFCKFYRTGSNESTKYNNNFVQKKLKLIHLIQQLKDYFRFYQNLIYFKQVTLVEGT